MLIKNILAMPGVWSLIRAFEFLQAAFNVIQSQLYYLKLILNTNRKAIEQASFNFFYAWSGALIQSSFKKKQKNLGSKLWMKRGFFFKHRSCFSQGQKRSVMASCLFSTMGTCCICECVIQMPSVFGHSFSLGTAICDWLQSSHPPLWII